MRNFWVVFIGLLIFSCSSTFLISSEAVGKYRLGQVLKGEFDSDILDISTDENNIITSIAVTSSQYKTSRGFRVGTSFDSIKEYSPNSEIAPINLSKGSKSVGILGEGITSDGVLFIDMTKDGLVDLILIQ